MAAKTDRGIPLSAVNPRYLHTNSTSHTGPFSAIAELIDNAYDPDVSAKQFWIDKTAVKGLDCLTFMDNGNGMDYDTMHKMLSFGFSDKKAVRGHAPVGLYGNGFKSGSMRLGKDAIVFSMKDNTKCVGMLSQTYLEKIEAHNEFKESLKDILQFSLFNTKEELWSEFNAINGPCGTNSNGTRIIIWNLRKTLSDKLEFDFDKDRYDIRIPIDISENSAEPNKESEHKTSAPESEYSLRAYTSILYLKPRMQINIRGQMVKTQLISKSLAHVDKDSYKPTCVKKAIKITFGYNTKSRDHYGLMMYHKNRLIKAYERVACQRKANNTGVRVIGVIECNYLTPMHNKQDFDNTEEYRRTIQSLNTKLEEYWKEIRHRRLQKNCIVPIEDEVKQPDQNWVQCNDCNKWRKLPDGIDSAKLPEKWFCRMNPDNQYRSCTVEQELSDSEDEQPRMQKTYKVHEKLEKEKHKQQKEQQQRAEKEIIVHLAKQNAKLRVLQHQFKLGNRTEENSPREMSSSPLSSHSHRLAGSSPSCTPILTRRKRAQSPCRDNGETKRARKRVSFGANIPGSPSTSTAILKDCFSPNIDSRDDDGDHAAEIDNETVPMDDDDEDNDITIIESISSPRPKSAKGTIDIAIVKTEPVGSQEELGKQKDCPDSDTTVSKETATAHLPSVSSKEVSIGTQTHQILILKQEDKDSGQPDNEKCNNSDGRHFESGKDPSPVDKNANKHMNSIIEERITQQTSVPHIEEENLDRNESTLNPEEELSRRNHSDEISPGAQGTATFEKSILNLMDAQTQQDKLLTLLEEAAQERDKSHAQLLLLGSEVDELKKQLLELTLKKEHSHNSTQTNPEEGPDYKMLHLQGKEEIKQLQDELGKLKMEKAEMERRGQGASLECDDLVCQIDTLLREMDQRNKEKEELNEKVDSLQKQNCTLSSCCESLKKDLEEMKTKIVKIENVQAEDQGVQTDFAVFSHEKSATTSAHASTSGRGTDSHSMQHEAQERPEMAAEIKQETSNLQTYSLKLRDLRQKVAHLLVTFVPALDLQQVNYDCDVIDEILTQVVDEISAT
ncbi:hypothetical protein HF521_016134 [Silurus meridionalis]|uniref:CW-type domain-containing protein n=1 Tax=Silurus meridionalis TaxID=175797 RepID=A0A8T0BQJ5_SILME|nr:hypothetical protein HF521_016134 [Silurus meridionalis]